VPDPNGPVPGQPQAGGAADPTMEDILASIRKILNEDETATLAVPPAAELATPATQPLALTEDMLVPTTSTEPAAAEPAPIPAEPAPAAPVQERTAPATAASTPAVEAPAASAPSTADLVAPAVAAAAAAAVGSLVRAVAAERHATVSRGGPSIEDVVREEIRPLLKAWLDEHLPPMVERLVRAEIERVVGRSLP